MLLRGKEFPNVWCAPGAAGWAGEGYRYKYLLALIPGASRKGLAKVAKTTTLRENIGNMPLTKDGLRPKQFKPKCIKVYFWLASVINAVGLSGPGAHKLLKSGVWSKIDEPFMLSFMTIAQESEDRIDEFREFCGTLKAYLQTIPAYRRGLLALQLNFACPNTGHDLEDRYAELTVMLDMAAELGIPIVVNLNPLVPWRVLEICQDHDACDAVWLGNTIPWNSTVAINWWKYASGRDSEGNPLSPLIKRGFKQPGGLSSPDCLSLTAQKVHEARQNGFTKPIIAGNGIQHTYDIDYLEAVGATGVAIGVLPMVRPYRTRGVINYAHARLDKAA